MKNDERFRGVLRTIGLASDEALKGSAIKERKPHPLPIGPILAVTTMFAAVLAYLLYWFLR